MTFTPKPGQQVRVVKCVGDMPDHEGRVGKMVNAYAGGAGSRFNVAWTGETCVATEVAPVCQPGDVLTTEPPTGSTVRIGQAYYRLGHDGTSWFDRGDMHRYSWGQLATMATLNSADIIFVSHEEARPTFVVGEAITAEMGEPPVGSVVKWEGIEYTRVEEQHLAHWENENGLSFVRWVHLVGEATLVSLPDQRAEGPCVKVGDRVTVEMAELPVGTVLACQYGSRVCLWTRIAGEPPTKSTGSWATPGWTPRGWSEMFEARCGMERFVVHSLPGQPTEGPSPMPEVREVPLSEARAGDAGRLPFHVIERSGNRILIEIGILHRITNEGIWLSDNAEVTEASVRRVATPLPTKPGTVGTATVGGEKTRIALDGNGIWYDLLTYEAVDEDDITDFVELLAGEDR